MGMRPGSPFRAFVLARFLKEKFMTKLLVVETSPRGEHSVSRNMTRRFVEDWRHAHANGEVVERDLAQTGLAFVDAAWLQAYFTPPPQQTYAMKGALALSEELVTELVA